MHYAIIKIFHLSQILGHWNGHTKKNSKWHGWNYIEIKKIKDMYRNNVICYNVNIVMYIWYKFMTYNNQSNYNYKASIRYPVMDMSREICPDISKYVAKYVAWNMSHTINLSTRIERSIYHEGRRHWGDKEFF